MLVLFNVTMELSNMKKKLCTTECDKSIVRNDVGTDQCDNEIVKCEEKKKVPPNVIKVRLEAMLIIF